jgi:hypothetical protein
MKAVRATAKNKQVQLLRSLKIVFNPYQVHLMQVEIKKSA